MGTPYSFCISILSVNAPSFSKAPGVARGKCVWPTAWIGLFCNVLSANEEKSIKTNLKVGE